MSLALWTEYKSQALMQSIIQTTPPIPVGNGALWTRRNGAGGSNVSIIRVPGPTLDRAYLVGRQRHLFRITAASTSQSSWIGCGCMMSQEDVTAGAGSCYAVCLETANTLGTIGQMKLMKFTSGLVSASGGTGATQVGIESGLSIALGTIVAIELRWRLDIAQFGGVAFEVYRGSALDFSDLGTAKITTQNTSSPLTSTVNEFVGMYANTTGNLEGYIDHTRMTRRV